MLFLIRRYVVSLAAGCSSNVEHEKTGRSKPGFTVRKRVTCAGRNWIGFAKIQLANNANVGFGVRTIGIGPANCAENSRPFA